MEAKSKNARLKCAGSRFALLSPGPLPYSRRTISEAVRNIPYGIQQPAMSGQVIQLEEFLGVTLFHRRPFALTPPGEELYQFIKPFFDHLQAMADKLRG